jgi:hypothetical protein
MQMFIIFAKYEEVFRNIFICFAFVVVGIGTVFPELCGENTTVESACAQSEYWFRKAFP